MRAIAFSFVVALIYACALAAMLWTFDPVRLAAVKQHKAFESYCPPDPHECD